jgi:hypothetical protein
MKTAVMISLLILMTIGLAAQTGYFDLSFGAKLAICDSLLRSQGLACKDTLAQGNWEFNKQSAFTYYPTSDFPEDEHLARVNIYFEPGKPGLKGWCAYYYLGKEENIGKRILSKLQEIHDNKIVSSGQTSTCNFDNNRYLETGNSSDFFYFWYNTRN